MSNQLATLLAEPRPASGCPEYPAPGKSVAVIGAGNIGSHFAAAVARMESVTNIVIVDPDVYEAKNLAGQDITRADVGRPKAPVQARRLRRISPAISVRPYCCRVEEMPLGTLQVDAIVSCLDNRASRRYLNEMAWRLGVGLVDGAVDAAGLLARVNAYLPGPDAPCMECGWDDSDYDAAVLEQPYACQKASSAQATNAPAGLGLVAAGLMALECQKLLAGDFESLLAGRQVMVDMRHHTHYVTNFRRRACRFDHETWHIEPIEPSPAEMTLGQALDLAADGRPPDGDAQTGDWALRVEGQNFATMRYCSECGHHEPMPLRLAGRIPPEQRRCAACGKTAMAVRGFDMREWLAGQSLNGEELARPLSALGVEPRDVIAVRGTAGVRRLMLATPQFPAGGHAAGHRPARGWSPGFSR